MILGTGIDIEEVHRIERAIGEYGDRFINRTFTANEISYCNAKANRFMHYAARFAAKEAFFKALGKAQHKGIAWKDMEVRHDQGNRPHLHLYRKAKELAGQLGVKNSFLSLSHSKSYAIAQVILTK